MNILIFGASGATGQVLVQQALEQGHYVTAFVRNPEKLKQHSDLLRIVQGNVQDYSSVEAAIRNHEIVISALGVSVPLKRDPMVINGIRNIVVAMQKGEAKRFIYLSFIGVRESRKNSGFMIRNIISRIVKEEIRDHEEKEMIIRNSKLNWTIVRPPKLTNGSRKGKYKFGENLVAKSFFPTLSREDLSEFMLNQAKDKQLSGRAVNVLE